MFRLDSSVVSTYQFLLFPCVEMFSLGLTLGRVVLVEVTKKVMLYIVFKQFQANLMSYSQIGTVNSIYIYTLLAIL